MHTNVVKNRHQTWVDKYSLNATFPTSHSHDKSNERIDIAIKESLSVEIYYSTKTAVQYSTDDFIQTKPISTPHNTNIIR